MVRAGGIDREYRLHCHPRNDINCQDIRIKRNEQKQLVRMRVSSYWKHVIRLYFPDERGVKPCTDL